MGFASLYPSYGGGPVCTSELTSHPGGSKLNHHRTVPWQLSVRRTPAALPPSRMWSSAVQQRRPRKTNLATGSTPDRSGAAPAKRGARHPARHCARTASAQSATGRDGCPHGAMAHVSGFARAELRISCSAASCSCHIGTIRRVIGPRPAAKVLAPAHLPLAIRAFPAQTR
jgi:hypothetical protein